MDDCHRIKIISECARISCSRDMLIYLYTSPNLSAVIICDPSLLKAIAMTRLGTSLPHNKID
jgi:hypothetical protein